MPLVDEVEPLHDGDVLHQRFNAHVVNHQHVGIHQRVHFLLFAGEVRAASDVQEAVGADHHHVEAALQQSLRDGVHQVRFAQTALPHQQQIHRRSVGVLFGVLFALVAQHVHQLPLAVLFARQRLVGEHIRVKRGERLLRLFAQADLAVQPRIERTAQARAHFANRLADVACVAALLAAVDGVKIIRREAALAEQIGDALVHHAHAGGQVIRRRFAVQNAAHAAENQVLPLGEVLPNLRAAGDNLLPPPKLLLRIFEALLLVLLLQCLHDFLTHGFPPTPASWRP